MKKIDKAVEIVSLMSDESLANWIKRVNVCPCNFRLKDGTCEFITCEECWNEEVEE